MQNDPSTYSENPSTNTPLDADDWDVPLEPYENHHHEAIGLACLLIVLGAYLKNKPPKISIALQSIEAAIEVLYNHTDFPKSSYELFRKRIEGDATLEDDDLMESLGMEF
jgi:hypothetical protein